MKMMRRFEPWAAVRRVPAVGLACFLVACGGGTSQVESFNPSRLIAFGDEASAFEADGRKHAVNGLASGTTNRDCLALPIWTQVVASGYGFGFAECPVGSGTQKAVSRAQAGATVASIAAQVAAQADLGGRDLVTVLVGVNDVKALYNESLLPGSRSRDQLLAEAKARGVTLGNSLKSISDRGARVIVSTIPDLGLSPFGRAQTTASAGFLTALSAEFNRGLRVNLPGQSDNGGDGRKVALVFADLLSQQASTNPDTYSLDNPSGAVCSGATLPNCTTATLVAGANPSRWLWADDTWFADGGHRQLGSDALARARNNPF
jgi:outer membrane lipase/esterase